MINEPFPEKTKVNNRTSLINNIVPEIRRIGLSCLILSLAGTALIYGCAKVKVRKVPTPTQYVRWTDQQQDKAD